jgi:hypothetical protein
MRKIIFLISFMLMISCSNNKSFEKNEVLIEENPVKEYSTNSLVKEKFLELYDLNLLLENNPQFEENIKKRLDYFTLDSSKILKLNKTSKIKNIQVIKYNSEITFKIIFDLETENFTKKDSVLAKLSEEEIIVDDTKTKSTKIKFSRFN